VYRHRILSNTRDAILSGAAFLGQVLDQYLQTDAARNCGRSPE
jgi:hypothetical protein